MEDMILILSVCDNIMILKVFYFIKTLLNIVFLVVPIGLILMITLDFAKNVISGKEDDMRKNLNLVFKRLIYAVILFLVPTIVEFAINGIGGFNVNYKDCFNVSKEVIANKENLQAATCTGDKYWWNDTLGICEEKEIYSDSPIIDDSDVVKKNIVNSHTGVKNFKYYNQGNYAHIKYCSGSKNVRSSGCGATSLSMIATSFSGKKYDPPYVAKWICNHGHEGGGTPWKFFTMKSMLRDFDLEVETLFKKKGLIRGNAGKKYDATLGNKILTAVQSGKGVLLHVPGHYVAVGPNEKCSSNQVYLYDPGKRSNIGCYTMEGLFKQTYNHRNRCKEKGNCGWKAAFAYNSAK